MYCQNCGNKLNEGDKFCANCGSQVPQNNIPITSNINYTITPPKKNNTALIVGIVITVFVIIAFLIFAAIIGIASFILATTEYDGSRNSTSENYTTFNTITNKDVSFEYNPSTWHELKHTEENIKKLIYKDSSVSLIYETSDYYYTTNKLAEEVTKELQNNSYNKVEEQTININGIDWIKIIYRKDYSIIYAFVYANNYDLYTFSYNTTSQTPSQIIEPNDLKEMYMSLKVDKSNNIISEQQAKEILKGEWDWGTSGYFVIEDNNIYLYKDSSKSMDNVFVGTYIADNKVATYAAGYTEGLYLLMTINTAYIDGQERTNYKGNQSEFVFIPNQDGTYIIKNLSSGNIGSATKIK